MYCSFTEEERLRKEQEEKDRSEREKSEAVERKRLEAEVNTLDCCRSILDRAKVTTADNT